MSRPQTPVKRERRLLDIFSPRGAAPAPIPSGDEDPDYQVQTYTCTPVITDVKSIPQPSSHDAAFTTLFEHLGEDNHALDEVLWHYVESNGTTAEDGPDIIQAINHQFDLIRIAARYALSAYDAKKTALSNAIAKTDQLQKEREQLLKSHEEETDALHVELNRTHDELKALKATSTTKKTDYDLPEWLYKQKTTERATAFEIPKALRLPLQANPITTFDGTGETEIVFKFLKDLEHHIKLLHDDFTNAQKIKYATGYMAGTALDWAIDWRRQPSHITWSQFLYDFRLKYVSPNAHIYLTNKLERMEFKAASIDTFNHEYKSTLRLLELDPSSIVESSQYFQIYTRKIRDPQIVMAIQQLSFTTNLTLSVVMDYAARLLAAKLAAQPLRTGPSRPPGTPRSAAPKPGSSSKPSRRPFQPKAHHIEYDEEEVYDAHAINPRTGKPRGPPRCFACDSYDHLIHECEFKQEWDQFRSKKQEQDSTGKD
ncbi:hypothetical protein BJ508DRAFT_332993 [Ascobolus immersus RN42]|uniref:Ty3 transposon capsid-like protein domain-containing protein n=1 Tax=Ascobolus immersus RN42 TaxID=1160509 RepID=A0A3N4HKZ2_ASCIM|nr:hypothetical protein BJ508DRAFT_332993 [Ascobolus immersus RN42]